ncbi:MAG: hypothetical protein IPM91_16845 [Bacteroidetes bacterium]|nr:hypothetical protein [Bacteroidota bacterium]
MKASVVNSFTLKHFRQHLLLMFAFILSSWSSIAQTSQTYSSSSTWVAPAGVTSITVECWGGGGKGGSTIFNGAETGGGGGGLIPDPTLLLLFLAPAIRLLLEPVVQEPEPVEIPGLDQPPLY